MSAAAEQNRALYEDLWRYFNIFPYNRWSCWQEIDSFAVGACRFEIGPGRLPHLPSEDKYFSDHSLAKLSEIKDQNRICVQGAIPLPFADKRFDLICMFELIGHVEDDDALLTEIARVLRPNGTLFLSCPMNPDYLTYNDTLLGQQRRYQAQELKEKLLCHGFKIERVCPRDDRRTGSFGLCFGMGIKYFPALTCSIIKYCLPTMGVKSWQWMDPGALAEAEQRGGLTLRARKIS